jgi:enterochelin esterase-like enzyme
LEDEDLPMRTMLLAAALLTGCATHDAHVTYHELESAAEGRTMPYAVYQPPGWDGETPLPLVVFLHGGGDDHEVLDKHPIAIKTIDRMIETGELPPFLLVAPNGRGGYWRNWADESHHYEDWVMDEVIPDVYARYPLLPEPEGMHVMGISMGGAGSLHLGLRHLDRFASIAAWSPPVIPADVAHKYLENNFFGRIFPLREIFGHPSLEELDADNAFGRTRTPDALQGTRLLIGAGTTDMFRIPKAARDYHAHLVEQDVPHRYVVYKGGHRWVDWAKVFPVALCYHLTPERACGIEPAGFYRVATHRAEALRGDQVAQSDAPATSSVSSAVQP